MMKVTSNRIAIFLLSVVAILASAQDADGALTPQQVAQKAAAVISGAKSISASFTIKGNGRSAKGTVKCAGDKFTVSLPDVSTWYNGKLMYTYNPRIGETTLTVPTAQELLESNPLLYVRGGGSAYTYRFSTVRRTGKYVVELTPVKNKSGLKKLTFTINAKTFHTERIVIDTTGGTMAVDVTSFSTGVPLSASTFEYPEAKYPKAEIIDLR